MIKEVSSNIVKIAVVQFTASTSIEHNFQFCKEQIEQASKNNAQMVFLPENCYFIDKCKEEKWQFAKPILNNPDIERFKQLAKQNNIWLSIGSIQIQSPNYPTEKRVENTHIIIDNEGAIKQSYIKTHLFDVDIDSTNIIRESDVYVPGSQIQEPVDTPIGKLGLSICYDLRFPELYRKQAIKGATVFAIPSAFLKTTGQAHWHVLQRSRAIENTCFVIAAGLVGSPFEGRDLYGHSLVVDPWGKVLMDMQEDVGIAFCDIDLSQVQNVRSRLPCLSNRRQDLYD